MFRRFFIVKTGPDLICYLLLIVGILYIVGSVIVEITLSYRKQQDVLKAIRSRKRTIRLDDK